MRREQPAERVADDGDPLEAARVQRVEEVLHVRLGVPWGLPGRAAVAAEVDRDDAVLRQPLARQPLEAAAVAGDAVQGEHGAAALGAVREGMEFGHGAESWQRRRRRGLSFGA